MGLFNRQAAPAAEDLMTEEPKRDSITGPLPTAANPSKKHALPVYNHNGHLVTKGIHPDGESGRSGQSSQTAKTQHPPAGMPLLVLDLTFTDAAGILGVHPIHFLRVTWASSSTASKWVNVLWPFVPAAIALHFAHPNAHIWIFALNYIAMVPAANLIGFAGQELARKLPKVAGILIETAIGSVVEIVLFMVLIKKDPGTGDTTPTGSLIPVIQAAILGSILTNLLLCLGMCFFVGGIRREEQKFHAAISEAGSGILLVAGFGLLIPSAFYAALRGSTVNPGQEGFTPDKLRMNTRKISQGTSIVLIVAFLIYIFFNARSHDSVFADALEHDEERDEDRQEDLAKPKFTFIECIVALLISLACVTLIAIFLVEEIEHIVAKGVPDNFLGLILVPLVEKAAEHLTAVDEAWDNQMNFALYHCLGPSIQTALLNAPLVVIVGWALGKPMDLNFEIFMIVCLLLSILVVGRFLQDGSSNYLEGSLLVLVYIIIAVTTWYYPNADETATNSVASTGVASATAAAKMMARTLVPA